MAYAASSVHSSHCKIDHPPLWPSLIPHALSSKLTLHPQAPAQSLWSHQHIHRGRLGSIFNCFIDALKPVKAGAYRLVTRPTASGPACMFRTDEFWQSQYSTSTEVTTAAVLARAVPYRQDAIPSAPSLRTWSMLNYMQIARIQVLDGFVANAVTRFRFVSTFLVVVSQPPATNHRLISHHAVCVCR